MFARATTQTKVQLAAAVRRMSTSSGRKFFVGGNWKCNGSPAQVSVSVQHL